MRAGLEPAPTGEIFDGKNLSIPIFRQTENHYPKLCGNSKHFGTGGVNESRKTQGAPFWQRNYYEHIIRDEQSYLKKLPNIFLTIRFYGKKDQLHPGKNS